MPPVPNPLLTARWSSPSGLTETIEMRTLPVEEQARALFARGAALILVPPFAPALNNRANDYRLQDHRTEAKRDCLAAVAAGNPAPEYSHYGLGQIAEAEATATARVASMPRGWPPNPIISSPPTGWRLWDGPAPGATLTISGLPLRRPWS
jgi:hypothetical protein